MTKVSGVCRNLGVFILLLAVVSLPLAAQDKVLAVDNAPNPGSAPVGGSVILSQAPNAVNGFFSDPDCGICGGGQQSIADSFVLTAATTVGELMIWGGYFPTDTPSADTFTVIFHQDAGGLPGAVVATESGTPSRVATGVVLFGVAEYEYNYTLATPVALGPGTYHIEIFNDTTGNSDSFFWETGIVDPAAGVVGSSFAFENPGSAWNSNTVDSLAIVLFEAAPVPTMGLMPLALLGAVLLGLSLAMMGYRKQRQA